MIGLLIFGTIADLLLACVLITVSGFIFGGGPEGMRGDATGVAMLAIGLIACLGMPAAGFVLRGRDKAGLGVLLTWLPPVAAIAVIVAWPGA